MVKVLDPDHTLFGSRIIARNDVPDNPANSTEDNFVKESKDIRFVQPASTRWRRRGRLRGGVEGPVERDHGAEVRVLEPVRAVSTGDGREWVERGGAATAEWGRRGGVRRSVRGGGAGGELHGADGGARRAAAHS